MLKLNAGFSRKVGEPNYGSRGASVNVELELESALVADPDGLAVRIRELFAIARSSVEQELANGGPANNPVNGNGSAEHYRGNNGGHNGNGGHNNSIRYATASQVRAIRAICDRQKKMPDRVASQAFGVNAVEDLTVRQASQLIDNLKAAMAGQNGGGR